jgi:hypothetical protein
MFCLADDTPRCSASPCPLILQDQFSQIRLISLLIPNFRPRTLSMVAAATHPPSSYARFHAHCSPHAPFLPLLSPHHLHVAHGQLPWPWRLPWGREQVPPWRRDLGAPAASSRPTASHRRVQPRHGHRRLFWLSCYHCDIASHACRMMEPERACL